MLVTSCGKVPSNTSIPSYKTLQTDRIETLLLSSTPTNTLKPRMFFSDGEYMCPTKDWVNDTFVKHFTQFLFDFNVRVFVEGRNECDKFSLYGRTVANILNRHNTKGTGGIAVGEFVYLDGISAHSINFIIVSDSNGNLHLMYFEPQIMKEVKLNRDNIVPLRYSL